ncbi:MAG: hypothetical protein IJ898_06380 [Prevotella sp.]|nr:hypothetical protein [Prevotella sp.]
METKMLERGNYRNRDCQSVTSVVRLMWHWPWADISLAFQGEFSGQQ